MRAYYTTARKMLESGKENIPQEMIPSCSLVYSSPGTLSYNSPGALGFGVKRAALVIPQSVMLLVAPDCCGRNSTILSENEGYASRMFYLRMSESDLITGGHLRLIPQAIKEICKASNLAEDSGQERGYSGEDAKGQDNDKTVSHHRMERGDRGQDCRIRVVVVCVTCADALLGTDVERVCRAAEEALSTLGDDRCVRVVPSYMYALTREGKRPPMTAIRDTIYSLLERLPVNSRAVNLLGFFSPLSPQSELFALLESMGIRTVRQVSLCRTLDEYMLMGEANFNIVLNGEAVYAAERLKERLGLPYIELVRLYDTERIAKQYRLFAAAVGAQADEKLLAECKARAEKKVEELRELRGIHSEQVTVDSCPTQVAGGESDGGRDREAEKVSGDSGALSFAIGQMINASPFELAASLVRYGFLVPYIIASPSDTDWPYIKMLGVASPDTKIYPPTHPSMACWGSGYATEGEADEAAEVDIAVGKDIAPMFPHSAGIEWNSEDEPFGFQAVELFFASCLDALKSRQG